MKPTLILTALLLAPSAALHAEVLGKGESESVSPIFLTLQLNDLFFFVCRILTR
jgi:hypothetical protein